MRYLFAVIDNKHRESGEAPGEMLAIDAFNDKLEAAGQRILAVGLSSPSTGMVFDNRQGDKIQKQGPLIESDDFMAGMWILKIDTQEEAYILAGEASRVCNRQIEVRAIL